MKPLTLALIRQRYTPFGGAERFIDMALQALRRRGGLQVTLITREWRAEPAAGEAPADAQDGPAVVLCKPFHIGRVWRLWAFARAACRAVAAGDYDLVQSHERLACCDLFRAGDGVHREWLRQRDRVLPVWRRWLTRVSPFHRLILAQERAMFASPRLKVVIAISEMVKQDILRHYPDTRARIQVIYNGVDLERFQPGLRDQHRQAMRARLGVPADAPVLLFVGSGFERKGLGTVLRAMAALPAAVRLVAVGKDRQADRFRRLAQTLGVAERVHFAGPQGDVGPYYGMADLFVFPSLYEPFGNVVLEAMACGVPALVSRSCGAADVVPDARFVLDALAVEAWSEAVLTALAEARAGGALGRQARLAAESFAPARMAAEMSALYAALVERPPA